MDKLLIKFNNLIEKNPVKAIHFVKKAINENPGNFDYLEALGKYLCSIKEDKEGVKYLQRADKISELAPNSKFILALSLMRTEQYHLAIKQFDKVNSIYPEAFYNTALCYIRMNKIEDAILSARNLLTVDILKKEALNLIIDIYSFVNDNDKVKIELENYRKLFGEDNYYHLMLGNDCFRKNNFMESAYHYSKIIGDEIKHDQYYQNYARSLSSIKHYKRASKIYQEIITEGYSQEKTIFDYAEVLYQLGRYQDIIDVINKYNSVILNKSLAKNIVSKAYYKLNLE